MAASAGKNGLRRQRLRQAKKEVKGDGSEGGQGVAAAVGEVLSSFLAAGAQIFENNKHLRWFDNFDLTYYSKLKKIRERHQPTSAATTPAATTSAVGTKASPVAKEEPAATEKGPEERLDAVFGSKCGFVCFVDLENAELPVTLYPVVKGTKVEKDGKVFPSTSNETIMTVDEKNSVSIDRCSYELITSDFWDFQSPTQRELLEGWVADIKAGEKHNRPNVWVDAMFSRELVKATLVAAGYSYEKVEADERKKLFGILPFAEDLAALEAS